MFRFIVGVHRMLGDPTFSLSKATEVEPYCEVAGTAILDVSYSSMKTRKEEATGE